MSSYDLIQSLINNKEEILERLDNTKDKDIVRLRTEAAENGVEMTLKEVRDHLDLLRRIITE